MKWGWPLLVLFGLVLTVAIVYAIREARWRGPLYCIERTGQVWGGEFGPVPAGFEPRCPQTNSYRAEVRQDESRVEQYTLSGWQPRALLPAVRRAGWRVTDDPINADTFSAFLETGARRLQYLARRVGEGTEITLSGR